MAQIRAGQIVAFYLFDIAETIGLQSIPGLVGGLATAARLAPKPPTPAYVQYDKPPVSYAARLFALGADRLGLGTWKANVQEKLKTLDDVYRFAVELSTISRGQFMELAIVLIVVLELVLFFVGVMK